MNRWTDYLMIPFLVFLAIVALWGGTALLFFSAALIAQILQSFTAWISGGLPQLLFKTFTDPWKIAALPIAIGVVILVAYLLWDDFQAKSGHEVMRGRKLGSSRPHQRVRPASSRSQPPARNGGRFPWTRSNPPRR